MNRRQFTSLLGGAAVASPFRLAAQQPSGRIAHIGFLNLSGPSTNDPRNPVAFKQGLLENGLVEGNNVEVSYGWADGSEARFRELATDLGQRNLDVIVTAGSKQVQILLATGTKMPIVFAIAGDPVGMGVVESLARPGGNVTGLSMSDNDLEIKRMELLKETVPLVQQVLILFDTIAGRAEAVAEAQAGARAVGIGAIVAEASNPNEFDAAFKRAREQGVDAVTAIASAFLNFNRKRLIELAAHHRLPSIWENEVYVSDGGLMSYGPNYADMYRRSAGYVARILKGAKPSELPVQQPIKFEFAINLKTAKALGLTIPPIVLARADEVIE